MPSVTLDSIREAADRKYGPYVVQFGDGGECTLRQALRLPADDRRRLAAVQDEISGESDLERLDYLVEGLRDMIRIVASRASDAEALISAVGDDTPVLMEIVAGWQGATEPGEASGSAA